jgi:1-acyl-sn-glycerol-3-phosphate acyltransferase
VDFAPGAFFPRLVQLLGILVLRPWVRFCFRARVRMPRTPLPEPCVFAANHRSFFDPPFVGMWHQHPLSYFARADLWKHPFVRFMLGVMYGIPIDRANPGLSSMKGAVQRLRQGICVLVFPEGTRTRSGRVGLLREGPPLFARRAGVAVVPVYIHRSERVWPRGAWLPNLCGGPIEIRFGRPLLPPRDLQPRLCDAWVARKLQHWIQAQEVSLLGPVSVAGHPASS